MARASATRARRPLVRYFLPTVAAECSESLFHVGRVEEAEHFAMLARDMTAPSDREANIGWRAALAKVRGRQGHGEEAESLAREAVELSASTGWLSLRGDALVSLARVLDMVGQRDKARQAVDEAIALYERKENVAAAANASALRDSFSSA